MGFILATDKCNYMLPVELLRLSFFPGSSDPIAET